MAVDDDIPTIANGSERLLIYAKCLLGIGGISQT